MTTLQFIREVELLKCDRQRENIKPSNLYVGRMQQGLILQWVDENGWYRDPAHRAVFKEGIARPELCGLKVYKVNSADHLEVV